MDLDDVIDTYKNYTQALKNVRGLKKAITAYVSAALADGVSIEFSQGDAPIVLATDSHEASFYCLEDGHSQYKGEIEGLTKTSLRTLIATWKALPADVLTKAFGEAVVRISSNGKLTMENQ